MPADSIDAIGWRAKYIAKSHHGRNKNIAGNRAQAVLAGR